jgi:hypothetical protein
MADFLFQVAEISPAAAIQNALLHHSHTRHNLISTPGAQQQYGKDLSLHSIHWPTLQNSLLA